MEKRFSRIVSGIMSVVMFIFSVVHISGVSAEEEFVTGVLDVTAVSATINDVEITNDTVVNDGDKIKLLFSWELNVGGYKPPVTFKYDLSSVLKNIVLTEGQTITINDAVYKIEGQDLYITLTAGESGRRGSCQLEGEIDLSGAQLVDGNRVTIQFIDKTYTPMAPSLISGLAVTKTADEFYYDDVAGKYYERYTIKVTNNSNVTATNISLTDTYSTGENSIFTDNTLVDFEIDGVPYNGSPAAENGATISLPDIPGKSEVVITYKTEVSAERALAGKWEVGNQAHVDYFNGENNVSADAYANVYNIPMPKINKTGIYDEATKKITWTITADAGFIKEDVENVVITDTPDGTYYTAAYIATVIPGAVSNGDGTVSITVPKANLTDGVYTFTYTTDIPAGSDETLFGAFINNKASATFNTDDSSYSYNSETTASIPGKTEQYVTKTAGEFDKENGTIDWEFTVVVPNDPSIKELTIWDKVDYEADQFIDYDSFSFTVGAENPNLIITKKQGNENHEFNIDFNDGGTNGLNDINDVIGKTIVVRYKTKVDTNVTGFESLTYKNHAHIWIKNAEYKQLEQYAEDIVTPTVVVTKGATGTTSYDKHGALGWEIKISQNNYVFSENEVIRIVDTIPTDHYYVDNSVRYWSQGGSVVITPSKNGQDVIFDVKLDAAAAENLNNGGMLSIMYDTAMDEEKYAELYMSTNVDINVPVKNDASVIVGEDSFDASHTQNIYIQPYKILNKSKTSESVNANSTFNASYQIYINSEKLDIIPGSDDIIVTDTLGYWLKPNGTPTIYPSEGVNWSYDEATRTYTFNLKDETTYSIDYSVTGNQVPVDHQVTPEVLKELFSNTVTLRGESGDETSRTVTISEGTFKSQGTYAYDMTIKGTKTWADAGYADARPKSVTLYIERTRTDIYGVTQETVVIPQTITIQPDANGNWTYILENLTIMDLECNKYTYVVKELEMDGYLVQYDTTAETASTTVNITNTFTAPSIEKGRLTVNKAWVDNDNAESTRPASIVITLTNETTGQTWNDTIDVAGGDSNAEFIDLPLYVYSRDANTDALVRTPCVYSVTESAVSGYTAQYPASFKLIETPVANVGLASPKVVSIVNTLDEEEETTTSTSEPEEDPEDSSDTTSSTSTPEEDPEESSSSSSSTSIPDEEPEESSSSSSSTSIPDEEPEESSSSSSSTSIPDEEPEESSSSSSSTSIPDEEPEESSSSSSSTSIPDEEPEESSSSSSSTSIPDEEPEESSSSSSSTSIPDEDPEDSSDTTTSTSVPDNTPVSSDTTTSTSVPDSTPVSSDTTTSTSAPDSTPASSDTTVSTSAPDTAPDSSATTSTATVTEPVTSVTSYRPVETTTNTSVVVTTTVLITTSHHPIRTTTEAEETTEEVTTTEETTTTEEETTTTTDEAITSASDEIGGVTTTKPVVVVGTTTTEDPLFGDWLDDDYYEGDTDSTEGYEENPNTSVSVNIYLVAALAFGAYAVYPRKKKNK